MSTPDNSPIEPKNGANIGGQSGQSSGAGAYYAAPPSTAGSVPGVPADTVGGSSQGAYRYPQSDPYGSINTQPYYYPKAANFGGGTALAVPAQKSPKTVLIIVVAALATLALVLGGTLLFVMVNRGGHGGGIGSTFGAGGYNAAKYQWLDDSLAPEYKNGATEVWRVKVKHTADSLTRPYVSRNGNIVAVVREGDIGPLMSITGYELSTGKIAWRKEFAGDNAELSDDKFNPPLRCVGNLNDRIICTDMTIDINTGKSEKLPGDYGNPFYATSDRVLFW